MESLMLGHTTNLTEALPSPRNVVLTRNFLVSTNELIGHHAPKENEVTCHKDFFHPP